MLLETELLTGGGLLVGGGLLTGGGLPTGGGLGGGLLVATLPNDKLT